MSLPMTEIPDSDADRQPCYFDQENNRMIHRGGCGVCPPTYQDLCNRIDQLEFKINALIELLGSVKDQLDPTLAALGNSPIGRMFGLKGGDND